MSKIIIIPIGFDKPMEETKPDYSREFGMACWCDDMELCENEDHA